MGRNPKLTDDEVLRRAMMLLWRQGPARVSVRDLETALDMKAPSIYHRFGSMDGLRLAVLDYYIDRIVTSRVSKLLDGSGDPVSNLTRFLEQSVTEQKADGALIGCLLTTTGIELDESRSPELSATLRRGLNTIEEAIAREVHRADELGRLAPNTSPTSAIATVTLAGQGLMVMARAGVHPAELRAQARATGAGIAASDA